MKLRIGTLDTGDALGVVSAENQLLRYLGDALDAEDTMTADDYSKGYEIAEAILTSGKVLSD